MPGINEIISEVGYWEASEWGASVMSHETIDTDEPMNPIVRYYAIEHGEKFYFDLTLFDVVNRFKEYK